MATAPPAEQRFFSCVMVAGSAVKARAWRPTVSNVETSMTGMETAADYIGGTIQQINQKFCCGSDNFLETVEQRNNRKIDSPPKSGMRQWQLLDRAPRSSNGPWSSTTCERGNAWRGQKPRWYRHLLRMCLHVGRPRQTPWAKRWVANLAMKWGVSDQPSGIVRSVNVDQSGGLRYRAVFDGRLLVFLFNHATCRLTLKSRSPRMYKNHPLPLGIGK